MQIHELAEKTGLTAPTIRFYEKEGLLDARHVHREGNNYRGYSDKAIGHLKLIKSLQSVGFSLAEIKDFLHEQTANKFTKKMALEIIREKLREIERKKNEFEQIENTLERLEHKFSSMRIPENESDG